MTLAKTLYSALLMAGGLFAISPAGAQAVGSESLSGEEDLIFACGFECPATSAFVTLREYTQTQSSGGMGAQWGEHLGSDQTFNAGNKPTHVNPLEPPEEFRVRAWRFTAPEAPLTGFLIHPPSGNHVTMISSCPADLDVLPACRMNGGNSQMKWSTRPNEIGACLLEPGKTYYLQAAHFSLSGYVNNDTILNTCGCTNPPCASCKLSISATQAE